MSLGSRLGCKAFRKPLISRFPSAHNLRLRCNQYWEAPVACHMCFTCTQNVIIKIQKEKKNSSKVLLLIYLLTRTMRPML